MIYSKKDAMTGTGRDTLLISAEDAASLSVGEGDPVLVKSDNGATMQCHIHIDQIQPRTVQAFWPECNVLIRRRTCDLQAGVPDYNAIIEIEPLNARQAVLVTSGAQAH
jgi:formylmethanofuran dehydrogenase subunit D